MASEDNGKPVCDMGRAELMAAVVWHDDETLREKAFEAFLSHEHDEELRIMVAGYRKADRERDRRLARLYRERKGGK